MGDKLTLKFGFQKSSIKSVAKLRMRSTTTFKVIFDFWYVREGVDISSIGLYKFLSDGDRILPHETPGGRKMKDGAKIDVFYEADGGQ